MIRALRDWVDHRTGLGGVIDALLLEKIPGGAKWRYVWGSALAFVFSLQLITGVLLMTAYSPGDTTAWSSVYFIQYKMDFGWLIRGLHHFGSQTMVVLMGVHMLQVVIAGAHLKPREVNWWLGLGLLAVILGLSLTGYLLPWDQKGYYATQVATNIAGNVPVVGPLVQKVVVGGPEYGNHTLTRFFALHVAILPGIVVALLIAHIWVFRRHGVTHPQNTKGKVGWFWPDQAFRDMVVSLVVFAVLIGLVLWGWGNKVEPSPDAAGNLPVRSTYDRIAHAGQAGLGANLDAPADPDSPYPARPEWYFLFLFQLLKYFQGKLFLVGTLAIPAGVGLLLFILPFLGHGRMRMAARVFSVLVLVALIGGIAYLTAQAWVEDQHPHTFQSNVYVMNPTTGQPERDSKGQLIKTADPGPKKQPYFMLRDLVAPTRYDADKAIAFQKEMDEAEHKAKRAINLAGDGVPAAGPRLLLRNDPMTRGQVLFKDKCGACHAYGDVVKTEKPTGADLADFGSKEWLKGLLTDYDSDKYFGKTPLKGGKMSGFVAKAKKDPKIAADLPVIADWLATHPRKGPPPDQFKHCVDCHSYDRKPDEDYSEGPDLTGYGDEEWLRAMIVYPWSEARYGKKNRMPSFRDLESPGSELAKEQYEVEKARALKDSDPKDAKAVKDWTRSHEVQHLPDLDRELIIRFILKDPRVVFGGEPFGGAPKKK